jgi:hypothetical protein
LTATSPKAVGALYLGRPLGLLFEPIQGEGGRSLFPKAGPPERVALNEIKHEIVFFSDSEQLMASVAGWGLSGGASLEGGRHHATHRAYQLEYALVLDDTTRMKREGK